VQTPSASIILSLCNQGIWADQEFTIQQGW